jgi:ribonuclease BN (tRNA processing enzyme)
MHLKMTFLGTGSAFTVGDDNYHSNILLQKNKDTLLLDAGADVRFSLAEQNLSYQDIHNLYISHLHADHIGGIEWLALTTHFDENCTRKPRLFAADKIITDLWRKSLCGGLQTLTAQVSTLDTFFDVQPVSDNGSFCWQDVEFKLVQEIHAYNNLKLMPCYGLIFEQGATRIFFTADTQYAPQQLHEVYREADIIFHDCETAVVKSGVHAHYSELIHVPAEFKKKMWLYHYNPGPLPDAKADGFLGFVKKGQSFDF